MATRTINELPFDEVWAFDFEFYGTENGDRPTVVCLVARELRTGRTIRLWENELGPEPPYRIDDKALFISFVGNAECCCHLSRGWPMPARLFDLSPEFRNLVNGRAVEEGYSLVGALERYGLATIGHRTKEAWRERILQGPPFTDVEKQGILKYCQSDVDALEPLLAHLLPTIDLPRALLRGEFVKASALMEHRGIPIDEEVFSQLRDPATWDRIREQLIPPIDAAYHVYQGRIFSEKLFEDYLRRHGIPWPRLESGRLDLKEETFRSQAKAYPQIAPLHELRHTLSKLRRIRLQVGADSRNRTVLWPFASKTSRTQPKATQYIFGPSVWLRSLIKPEPGRAVAYVDFSSMEFGIGAALSGDAQMMAAYQKQPYVDFAISFGAAPPGATKKSHPHVHEQYKVVLLGAQYGMRAPTLGARLGVSVIKAGEMLTHHHLLFGQYWRWSDHWLHRALSTGFMRTNFGWTYYLDRQDSERSIRNFPIQATGAEILRVSCILATRQGIQLLAPVHDAVLIESAIDQIEADVRRAQAIFRRASRIVLGNFTLRSDATIVRYPDRYSDKRGERMWATVTEMLAQGETRHAS